MLPLGLLDQSKAGEAWILFPYKSLKSEIALTFKHLLLWLSKCRKLLMWGSPFTWCKLVIVFMFVGHAFMNRVSPGDSYTAATLLWFDSLFVLLYFYFTLSTDRNYVQEFRTSSQSHWSGYIPSRDSASKMAINLNKNRSSLLEAWKDVFDEKTDTNWYESDITKMRILFY